MLDRALQDGGGSISLDPEDCMEQSLLSHNR